MEEGGAIMTEVEWLSIGPVAEKFNLEVPRLRTWCDKGLVAYDKRSTGRWIPTSEFPKIKMIKEIFERGGNVTFADVKQELIKANLYNQLQTNKEEEQKVQEMAVTLEKAFAKTGATELFSAIATEFNTVTRKVTEMSENQAQLLEKMDKLEQENEDLRGLVQQLVTSNSDFKETFTEYMKEKDSERQKQIELESKVEEFESQLNESKQSKGIFSRLFGKK